MPENINEHFGIAPGHVGEATYVPRATDEKDLAGEVKRLNAKVDALAGLVGKQQPEGLAQRMLAELRQRLPMLDGLLRDLRGRIEQIERRLRIIPAAASSGGVAHGNVTGPTTVGASTEGSDTANSTTWTWAGGGTPVEIWMVTDVVYSDAGDQKLYAMKRKLTFDTQGFLYSVSGETRVLVDTPST